MKSNEPSVLMKGKNYFKRDKKVENGQKVETEGENESKSAPEKLVFAIFFAERRQARCTGESSQRVDWKYRRHNLLMLDGMLQNVFIVLPSPFGKRTNVSSFTRRIIVVESSSKSRAFIVRCIFVYSRPPLYATRRCVCMYAFGMSRARWCAQQDDAYDK